MKTQILEQAATQRAMLESAFENQMKQMETYELLMRKASHVYPQVEKVLNKLGLVIADYNLPRFETTNAMGEAKEYKSICMSVRATKDETDKFKFITFQGYTARGDGKNQNRLHSKADKLAAKVSEATGCNATINPYSLEIKHADNSEKGNRILLDVFIRE